MKDNKSEYLSVKTINKEQHFIVVFICIPLCSFFNYMHIFLSWI